LTGVRPDAQIQWSTGVLLEYFRERAPLRSGQRVEDGREILRETARVEVSPGGCSVAKILVADDNSNIQKMVGLALKDQGIDVVAVGNGEAAVRKISDIHPDLVLADVFMPVRNGYEVCQYVKQDPALAHIPVILLVGAFDPLDEQEAQRVGADGVLKKPFVPPDPLIAMVKAALTRAGVAYSSEKTLGEDKSGRSGERKGAELLAPKPASVPVPAPVVMAPPVAPPESIVMEDLDVVEEVSLVPPPVKMVGEAPLAFGNLMESANAEEEDAGFVAAVHPELAGRDWRDAEEPQDVPEEEEEEKPKASWRRDAGDEEAAEGVTGAVRDWRDTAFSEPPTRKSAREDWGTTPAVPAMTEAAATQENTAATLQEEAVSAVTAAVTTIDPGQVTSEAIPEVTAYSADAWDSAISAGASEGAASSEEAQALSTNGSHTLTAEHAHDAGSEAAGELPAAALAVEHDAVATAIDRFAGSQDAQGEAEMAAPTATSAWEVQAMKANLLASTWDAPAAASAPVYSETAAVEEAPATFAAALAEAAAPMVENVDGQVAAAGEVAHAAGTQEIIHEEHAAEPEATANASAMSVEPAVSAEVETAIREAEAAPEVAANEAPAEEIQGTESFSATQAIEEPAVEQNIIHEEAAAAPVEEVAPEYGTEHGTQHDAEISNVEAITERVVESVYVAGPPAIETAAEHEAEAPATGAVAAEAKASNEDVVARVLASLSPEVMQAVTRELLKSVVEAMVREELNKKK
jgi:CheY-like chemotaxis protein